MTSPTGPAGMHACAAPIHPLIDIGGVPGCIGKHQTQDERRPPILPDRMVDDTPAALDWILGNP